MKRSVIRGQHLLLALPLPDYAPEGPALHPGYRKQRPDAALEMAGPAVVFTTAPSHMTTGGTVRLHHG